MRDIERESSAEAPSAAVAAIRDSHWKVAPAAQRMELVCCLREALIALEPDHHAGPMWVASLRARIRAALAIEPRT